MQTQENVKELDIVCPHKTVPALVKARAEGSPDKTYMYFQDKAWTYKEFHEITSKTADSFSKLGAKKGDKVALLIPNAPEFLFTFFGAFKSGLVGTTLNTLLKADELEFIINDSGAEILCTTPQYRKMLEPVWDKLTNIKHVILTSQEGAEEFPNGKDFYKFIEDGSPDFEADIDESDAGSMIYTSGTTGRPKGVLLSHANVIYNSYIMPRAIDLQPEDTSLCIMPLFHVNAQTASVLCTMQAGATFVLEEMFKPRIFINTLKKYKCSTFSGVPAMYNFLNEMKEADGEDLSFLKACICGAAPMPVEVFNKFEEKFQAKVLEGYGLTEGSCVSTINPLNGVRKIGSIGLPVDGQQVAIWDTDGKALADGEIGEIVIAGPNVMQGYHNNPEATAESITDGWCRTGDMGYRDQEGYYFISGRKKEMIIRGGENIYPKEIEEVLYEHDAVQDCAVVGIPDKKYGEEVAAFVIVKADANITPKDLKNYLGKKIASFKRPRTIEFVTDLPRTATGKIQKVKIVEEFIGTKSSIARVKGQVRIPYKWVYGDVLAKFYNGLKNEGKFYGVSTPSTGKVQCPPKSFDGTTMEATGELKEYENKCTLDSFTTVYMEFPGQPMKPPYTYGYFKLDGTNTHIYHLISEIAEEDIAVGQRYEAVWTDKEKRRGTLHDIQYFRPLKED